MNFLNRRMFQEGGGANQYYYVDKQNNQQIPLDENKLFEILQTAPIPELEALIQRGWKRGGSGGGGRKGYGRGRGGKGGRNRQRGGGGRGGWSRR